MGRGQCVRRNHGIQQQVPEGNVEQSESDHYQSHDRSATESDAQTAVQRGACGIGGTCGSIGSGLHAQESGKSGEESAGQEGYRYPMVLYIEAVGHDGEQDYQSEEDHPDDFVLLFQVRHGAFAYGGGNLHHLRSSFALFHHLAVEVPGKTEGQDRSDGYNPE